MTARLDIDWHTETARADWGAGVYALVCHRYPGAQTVWEVRTPTGELVRFKGFRTGVRWLYDRMMQECE